MAKATCVGARGTGKWRNTALSSHPPRGTGRSAMTHLMETGTKRCDAKCHEVRPAPGRASAPIYERRVQRGNGLPWTISLSNAPSRQGRKQFAQIAPRRLGPKGQDRDSEPDRLGQMEFSRAVKTAECAPANPTQPPSRPTPDAPTPVCRIPSANERVGPVACAPQQPSELEVS